jgi:hypothetical protein
MGTIFKDLKHKELLQRNFCVVSYLLEDIYIALKLEKLN